MKAKKFLAGFLAAAMAVSVSGLQISAGNEQSSDENDYYKLGYFDPTICKYVYEDGTIMEPIRSPITDVCAVDLPEKFDSRDEFSSRGLNFPAIRSQSPTGTCWVHATMASMETRGLMNGLFTNSMNVNFAESQVAYFSAVSSPDETDPYYGDSFSLCSDHTPQEIYDRGGNVLFATSTMARGIGPYDESHDSSLPINTTNATLALDESLRYQSDYQVTDCSDFNPENRDAIKNAIMEYGAVTVSYYHSNAYLSSDLNSYYQNNVKEGTNHAISIIGWDDNYSSSNFNSGYYTPTSDGAWLCRNSWGSNFGSGGYFYISYYEPELSGFYTVTAVPKNTYSKVYGYDGACSLFYDRPSGYFIANIFTAESSSDVTAAAFYTIDENVTYTLKVYTDITSNDPESGVLKSEQSGTIEHSGYHTIDLKTPVSISEGTKFSVVLSTSDTKQYIDTNNTSAGQSFQKLTSSSSWSDTYYKQLSYKCYLYDSSNHIVTLDNKNYNVCLRALTGTPSVTAPAAPTGLKAENSHKDYFKISCDAVDGASAYNFYITPASTGITAQYNYLYSELTTFEPEIGEKYSIYSTYKLNGVESEHSDTISFILTAAPQNVKISAGDTCADLSWDAVANAESYAVYYLNPTDYSYSFLKSSSSASCSITGLTNGTEYSYAVAAVNNGVESDYSEIVSVVPRSENDLMIISHPDSMEIIGGTMLSLNTQASGIGLTFTWEYNNGSGWQELPSSSNIYREDTSTKSVLKIYNTIGFGNAEFRCIVCDSDGNRAETNSAKLTFCDEADIPVSRIETLDSSDLVNYVNYFIALNENDDDSFLLTEAELRAIERVLEEDYNI